MTIVQKKPSEISAATISAFQTALNVLPKDNTDSFTPEADYEPATKKYVDATTVIVSDLVVNNSATIINDNEKSMLNSMALTIAEDLSFEQAGYGIEADGSLTSSWYGVRKRTTRKNVPKGATSCCVTTSLQSIDCIFFYDENDSYISSFGADVSLWQKNIVVEIPSNALYYRIQAARVTDEIPIYFSIFNGDAGVEIGVFLNGLPFTDGAFLVTSGSTYSNTDYKYYDYYSFIQGDKIEVSGLHQSVGYTVAAVCFYDTSKVFISYLDISSFGTDNVVLDSTNTPTNCAFVRLGSLSSKDVVFYSPVTAAGIKEDHSKVKNTITYSNIFISAPGKIRIAVGEKLEIFLRSLVNAFNYKNYNVEIYTVTGSPLFKNKGRKFEYTPTIAESFTVVFQLKNEFGTVISETDECVVDSFVKGSSPSSKLNVLMIGDSFTDQNVYPTELKRRLTGSGGVPVADGLTNVNFIGTQDISTTPNEGYSGVDYNYFASSSSPFWDGSSDVDFTNYMSNLITNNGTELNLTTGDKIDVAIIKLGTNKAHSETTIKKIWDKLIEHNSSIKIIVSGRNWVSPIGIGFAGGAAYNANEWALNSGTLEYNRQLEEWIIADYSANINFIDDQVVFDSEYNFPYELLPVNTRNSITEKSGTDGVHPAASGYYQIADAFYNAFHWEVLGSLE